MTEPLLSWAAVDNNMVVSGFDAPESFDFVEDVVNVAGLTTPAWWHAEVEFVDVTTVSPRPTIGWYRDGNGNWIDGTVSLTSDRPSIPADGTTFATITFKQKGPKAPAKVRFSVNGTEAEDPLVNGSAVLTVTSTNPGDQILVTAGGASVTILVEG